MESTNNTLSEKLLPQQQDLHVDPGIPVVRVVDNPNFQQQQQHPFIVDDDDDEHATAAFLTMEDPFGHTTTTTSPHNTQSSPLRYSKNDPENQQQQSATTATPTVRGEHQPSQFRDILFAILFVVHLLVIFYWALFWGIQALNHTGNDSDSSSSYLLIGHVLLVCFLCGLAALGWTTLLLNLLQRHVQNYMVEACLLFTLVCNGCLALIFLSQGYWLGTGVSLLLLATSTWYAKRVWHRIPFCTANLQTALVAVQSNNGGLAFVAYAMVFVSILFTLVWVLAAVGIMYYHAKQLSAAPAANANPSSYYNNENDDDFYASSSLLSTWSIMLLLLSYYWTISFLRNVLSVTVAGVVGTWWFAPDEASTYCSPAIMDSLARATTFSVGSIALGSLLTAILQVLNHAVSTLRRMSSSSSSRGRAAASAQASLLLCILDCIASFLHRLVSYFNKYAMVYVGLYGYDYLTAGKRTCDLFYHRGWTAIIKDDLMARVLGFLSVVLATLTAAVGVAMATLWQPFLWWNNATTDDASSSFVQHASIAATVTFLLGLATAQLLLGVVSAAVDTILVTFAEAPLDLERNHPGLYRKMVTAWFQVYPSCRV